MLIGKLVSRIAKTTISLSIGKLLATNGNFAKQIKITQRT
jgi:hypothetical protein